MVHHHSHFLLVWYLTLLLLIMMNFNRKCDAFKLSSRALFKNRKISKLRVEESALFESDEDCFIVEKSSCMNCGACWNIAPEVFKRLGVKCVINKQPDSEANLKKAGEALISCPTNSIQVTSPKMKRFLNKTISQNIPFPVDSERLPNVYHLGYHQIDNFGAAPYLIVRESGNIMINVPRFDINLVQAIEKLGGIDYLIITSKGFEKSHTLWKNQFPSMIRVAHQLDLTRITEVNPEGTLNVIEQSLEGRGAWELEDYSELKGRSTDILIVHTPGSSYGSLSVWYQHQTARKMCESSCSQSPAVHNQKTKSTAHDSSDKTTFHFESVLFSGKTLGYDMRLKALSGYSGHNEGSIEDQELSIKQLVDNPRFVPHWNWLLPSYGAIYRFEDKITQRKQILKAARDFKKNGRMLI